MPGIRDRAECTWVPCGTLVLLNQTLLLFLSSLYCLPSLDSLLLSAFSLNLTGDYFWIYAFGKDFALCNYGFILKAKSKFFLIV